MSVINVFCRKLCCVSNVRGSIVFNKFVTLCLLSCVVFMSVGLASAGGNPGVVSCTNVKSIFEGRGVKTALDILEEPITGGVCGTPASCCSASASTYLTALARREFETMMRTNANRVALTLQSRAKRFDEVFRSLLAHSKLEFHLMFTRTYGLIYERHAHLFADLFSDLERYHAKGDLDLAKAMDGFFAVLYQKMFAVLNSQYHFDDKYLSCVSEHMRELQPFGDVPRKLAVQVKRAFVATRTFTRALVQAADVARTMATMRGQGSCGPLIVRARSCGACSGAPEKACANLCLNAARACLPLFADISADWDAFVDTMDKVSDRLLGPFNIAMVVEPIDIKISEAIMNFQEHSQELSETVFTGCGKPVLGQRPVEPNNKFKTRVTRNANNYHTGYSEYRKRSADNSDDFEIETSEESLLKKNPFLLSRGSSRKQLLEENNERIIDFKSQNSVNTNVDQSNDLINEDEGYSNGKNFDKRMIYDRLVAGSRLRRDADPDPGKSSKEIEFESYNFDSEQQRGSGRRKGKKKQGGKKKKTEVIDEAFPENIPGGETDLHEGGGGGGGESRYGPSHDRMVREVRQKVKETRRIWSKLPQNYCDTVSAPDGDDKCWNGTHVAKYLSGLAGEGTAALATNPELRGSPGAASLPAAGGLGATGANSPTAALVTAQQFALRAIVSKLKNAYNGLDVVWEQEDDSASLTYGSGSGSGDDTTDEEDDTEPGGPPDQEEGSGHQIPEQPKFQDPEQDITEEHETPLFNPTVIKNPNQDTGIIDENERDNDIDLDQNNRIDDELEKDTSMSSGAEIKEEMSLHRAMITYLFPIVCVWFGGIITDIA